jgi:pyruvate dehydrogenase E1 component
VLLASVSEACVCYDAGWAFEMAYIMRDALRRMYSSTPDHPEGENIFYYLTIYNEPYPQPAEPAAFPGGKAALEQGILRGLYEYAPAAGHEPFGTGTAQTGAEPGEQPGETADHDSGRTDPRVHPDGARPESNAQILASGVAIRAALQAQKLLAEDWGVAASVWSATSWTELRRDAMACEEWNMLHPEAQSRVPYVTRLLDGARWVPAPYASLGTDGFGFSDTRAAARRFFHVDAESVTVAVLGQLAKRGEVKPDVLTQAIEKYRLDLPVSEALGDPQAVSQPAAPGRPEAETQPEVRA